MRAICSTNTAETCTVEARRQRVRESDTLGGIDYVEVYPDGITLCVHFFGARPPAITAKQVVIEGGARIRGLKVVWIKAHEEDDGSMCLRVRLDRKGDFSPYCLCLVGVERSIDERYSCAVFHFRNDCGADADCGSGEPCAAAPTLPAPAIDYLARDFSSFRRLMLDRLAQTMPQWRERHIPDLGMFLVEVFAYVADLLSYQLDSVAAEAFLRTTRRRISVRRHARLVDYFMHEGTNARAWLTLESDTDIREFALERWLFTAFRGDAVPGRGVVDWATLTRARSPLIYSPVAIDGRSVVPIIAAHSEIHFYTWGNRDCCLPAGSTSATLLNENAADHRSVLQLEKGDFLLLEEIRGCATAAAADADPLKRHVVRLIEVVERIDELSKTSVLEIEWAEEDALPFDLRLSVQAAPPGCTFEPAAVARGNVILAHHARPMDDPGEWTVGIESSETCCDCDGQNTWTRQKAARLQFELNAENITHADPLPPAGAPAAAFAQRDPRAALPLVSLQSSAPDAAPLIWTAVRDLLTSNGTDRHFVVEIDDTRRGQVRFGDGVTGRQPAPGWRFNARYQHGNGSDGNVGRDSIRWMASETESYPTARLRPRNPLPAAGGVDPESIDDVKLRAPHAYSRVLERAVSAKDYAQIAGEQSEVQGACAELAWTGSWYEACVALDLLASSDVERANAVAGRALEHARRVGHDLRVVPVRRVPLDVKIIVCLEPNALRSEVLRAVSARLSVRALSDGTRGMFHPDELRFGTDIAGSRIVAAVQDVPGVVHVELQRLARLGASDADALATFENNLVPMDVDEVAVLAADPNFPENGRLRVKLEGGR